MFLLLSNINEHRISCIMINLVKKIFFPIDLTSGKPWKVILLFAIPILLSNIFQQIYSISDAIIVGQSIPLQFAGINNTGPLSFMILEFAFGMTAGMSVITSNRYGKKDYDGVRKSFANSITISIITSIILTIISLGFKDVLLSWVGVAKEIDEVTYNAASIYITVIFIGLVSQIFYNLIVSINRSIGDSITPLLFLILSSITNIVLDLLFVNIMPTIDLKVAGVALATILAQALSAILCFLYTFHKYPYLKMHISDFKINYKELWDHIKLGFPLGIQFSILAIGIIVMQGKIVSFDYNVFIPGTNINAHYAQDGYGAACKLQNFLNAPYTAISIAMLSYIAQNKGKGDYLRVKEGIKDSYIIGFIIYIVVMTLGLLLTINGAFLYIFLKESQIYPETINYANTYLYTSLTAGIFLYLLLVNRNVLQALGKSLWPLVCGIVELFSRIFICGILPSLITKDSQSMISYLTVCFGDAGARTLGMLVLLFPLIYYLKSFFKKGKNSHINNQNEIIKQ